MAVYTELFLVPKADAEWEPDRAFLEDLFAHLGVTEVWALAGYSRALRLEHLEDLLASPLFQEWHLSPSAALTRCEEACRPGLFRRRAVVCHYSMTCPEWSQGAAAELGAIPEEIRGTFAPGDISISTGPCAVPTWDGEKTAGVWRFQVTVSGYGAPHDPNAYVRLAEATPLLAGLLTWLSSASQKPFSVLASHSF